MNAIEFLKSQHREVETLLNQLMTEEDRKEQKAALEKLARAFTAHSLIEEKLFYPAANRLFAEDRIAAGEELVLEAFEEHAAALGALDRLVATPPGDKRFLARVAVLRELIADHVEREEGELFPDVREKLGDEQLAKLGRDLERRFHRIEEAPAERSPRRQRRPRAGARARPAASAARRRGAGARARKGAKGSRAARSAQGERRAGTR
jgi:hemerythrin superfamily protein